MTFAALAFLLGTGLVIIESTLANVAAIGGIRPDFAVLIVVVATCRARFSRAMMLAFAFGLMRDFYSGGPLGMNAFSLTLTAYLMNAAEDYLMTNNWRGQFVFVFVGFLLYATIFFVLKILVGYEAAFPVQTITKMIWTSAYTAVLGPLFFTLMIKPQRLPYLRLKMKYDVDRETIPQTEV
jgi:rod shape-determining protein MreD